MIQNIYISDLKYKRAMEARYTNTKLGIDEVVRRLEAWLRQYGYDTRYYISGGWRVIEVSRGSALWKGAIKVYLYPQNTDIYVRIDTGSEGTAFLKGGLIAMSRQNELNKLAESIISAVGTISGGTRVQ